MTSSVVNIINSVGWTSYEILLSWSLFINRRPSFCRWIQYLIARLSEWSHLSQLSLTLNTFWSGNITFALETLIKSRVDNKIITELFMSSDLSKDAAFFWFRLLSEYKSALCTAAFSYVFHPAHFAPSRTSFPSNMCRNNVYLVLPLRNQSIRFFLWSVRVIVNFLFMEWLSHLTLFAFMMDS